MLKNSSWTAFLQAHFPDFAGLKPKDVSMQIRCAGAADCVNSIVVTSPARRGGLGWKRAGWSNLQKMLAGSGWAMSVGTIGADSGPVWTLVCPECAAALQEQLKTQGSVSSDALKAAGLKLSGNVPRASGNLEDS